MTKKFPCPCCNKHTLDEEPPGTYQICPICYWEDDGTQFDDPEYKSGANSVSLNEAKLNYKNFGAISTEFKEKVRLPLPEE